MSFNKEQKMYLEFLKEVLLYPDDIVTDDGNLYYYYKDDYLYFCYTIEDIREKFNIIETGKIYTFLKNWIKSEFNLKLQVE